MVQGLSAGDQTVFHTAFSHLSEIVLTDTAELSAQKGSLSEGNTSGQLRTRDASAGPVKLEMLRLSGRIRADCSGRSQRDRIPPRARRLPDAPRDRSRGLAERGTVSGHGQFFARAPVRDEADTGPAFDDRSPVQSSAGIDSTAAVSADGSTGAEYQGVNCILREEI